MGVNTVEHSPIDNFLEKKYQYPNKITALSITPPGDFEKKYPEVKFIQYDGGKFPFKDGEFEFVHSNAVIEHVGGFSDQQKFLQELIRVSKKGVFFTTPNKYFPIEMHTNILFLHFLPKFLFDKLLVLFNKSWASGDYMYLLSAFDLKKMIKCNSKSYQSFNIKKERLFGFTYQLICMLKH